MLTFHRQQFSELWITIKAGESLAVLDSSYIEDYFGVDGQLTLRNLQDDTTISFLMAEDLDETPSVAHDVFSGFIELDVLEDGLYQVEGRVRDSLGNYRILSDYHDPLGTEDITLFEIQITPLAIVVNIPKTADILQVIGAESDLFLRVKPDANLQFVDRQLTSDLLFVDKPGLDIYVVPKANADLVLQSTAELDILNVYTTL